MDLSVPFQKPHDSNPTTCITSAFGLAPATDIALILLNLTVHHGRFLTQNLFVDGLARIVKNKTVVLLMKPENPEAELAVMSAQKCSISLIYIPRSRLLRRRTVRTGQKQPFSAI